MKQKRPIIEHRIIEVFGIKEEILLKGENILPKIKDFIKETGLKVVSHGYYNFTPYGATIVFILSSSHIAVHTWPENNYLHIDLVTCAKVKGDSFLRKEIENIFSVKPAQIKIKKIEYENNSI